MLQFLKTSIMATVKKATQAKTTQTSKTGNKKRAENKDNIDSRKDEEFDFKGDDVTHNKKQTRKEK